VARLAGVTPNCVPRLELDAQFLQPESTATGFSSTSWY
jgi:hypothetical protein